MQELRPTSADSDQSTLRIRLEELCHRASSLWSVEVEYEVIGEIGPQVSWDVYRLAQEALVNAARHAQATSIRITVSVRPYTIAIRVVDNGRGFPFHGVYDLATLNARKIGPLSLKERISSLRGNLILD